MTLQRSFIFSQVRNFLSYVNSTIERYLNYAKEPVQDGFSQGRDYYRLEMGYGMFRKMINNLDLLWKTQLDIRDHEKAIGNFINDFGLLDFREFRQAPLQSA